MCWWLRVTMVTMGNRLAEDSTEDDDVSDYNDL